jgi:hypothetical protein
MRDIYRNPMLYYVLIPVLVGMWPLLVGVLYLPQAETAREVEAQLCVEGQARVIDILRIDPDRPNMLDKGQKAVAFEYGPAVDRVVNLCRIPSSSYTLTTQLPAVSGGKKRQEGRVTLANVEIAQAAKFLSNIESMWVNLQCEHAKLTKKKGMADLWDVDFRFLYYY